MSDPIDELLRSIEYDRALRLEGPTYVVGVVHGDTENEYGPIIHGPYGGDETDRIREAVEDTWLAMDAAALKIDGEADVFLVDPSKTRGDIL